MPPWKPTAGVGPKLKHDQSLTHAEIAILVAWALAGAPLGDPKDLPPPPKFAEGWKLGPPDLILEPSEGFPVAASGPDVYRCFVLPTNLTQDSYLEAVDYAAGERAAVHHLIAYIDTTGLGRNTTPTHQGRATPPPGAGRRGRRIELLDSRQRAPPLARWRRYPRSRPVRYHPPGPLPPLRQGRY